MSLLWMEYEAEFEHLVENAFHCECSRKPDYFSSLSQRVRKIIYRDTRYNIDYLYTAYVLNDEKIIESYAVWLFKLMDGIFKHFTSEQTADYVIHHLNAIRDSIPESVSAEKHERLLHLMDVAKESILRYVASDDEPVQRPSHYEQYIHDYMDCLFRKDTLHSMQLIREYMEDGIPLEDIYVEILSESMRRVGELWHNAEITVDTEHYCTSVTQMAMSQMYSILFDGERKDKTVLCACPGAELHEMGARIVADLFANDGWDSIFLGAAVPTDYIVASVRENRPDLLTLSVSMPQHLITCRETIDAVREEFPEIKIAVGGKAFESTDDIWKHWPIDIYTLDARDLLAQANHIC